MIGHRPRVLGCAPQARKFARDRRGIAATEFALILPVMLVMFFGVTEVGQAISASRKVTITARTITDLVTQYSALATTDMSTLLGASAQVMAPYPSANLTVTVSEVSTDSSGNATITWSASLNGTAYTTGQKVTLPSGLDLPNITLIWGQVQYLYTPIFGDKIIGTTPLTDQIYLSPRLCTSIAYPASATSTDTSACASSQTATSSSGSGSGSSGSGGSSSGSSGSGSSGSGSSGSGGSGSGPSGSGGSGSGSSGGSGNGSGKGRL